VTGGGLLSLMPRYLEDCDHWVPGSHGTKVHREAWCSMSRGTSATGGHGTWKIERPWDRGKSLHREPGDPFDDRAWIPGSRVPRSLLSAYDLASRYQAAIVPSWSKSLGHEAPGPIGPSVPMEQGAKGPGDRGTMECGPMGVKLPGFLRALVSS
jgi:hypothetical protein